jgi:hypothetical protein
MSGNFAVMPSKEPAHPVDRMALGSIVAPQRAGPAPRLFPTDKGHLSHRQQVVDRPWVAGREWVAVAARVAITGA